MPSLSEVFAHLEKGGIVRLSKGSDTYDLEQVLDGLEPYLEPDWGGDTVEQDITLDQLRHCTLLPRPRISTTLAGSYDLDAVCAVLPEREVQFLKGKGADCNSRFKISLQELEE